MRSDAACSQLQCASHSSPLSDETLLTNVMCGVLSGVISSSIANPTDVLKVDICTHEDCVDSPGPVLINVLSVIIQSNRAGLTISAALRAGKFH